MRKVNGYFTVEAALIFPFVMGVVLLIIYLLFFQYDRCLMEQSAGVLALRGCTLQIQDNKDIVKAVFMQAQEEDKSYLAWQMDNANISMKGNRFTVSRVGALKFPFRGMDFWDGGSLWESSATYENQRIRPVFFIRNYKKFTGGK